MYAAVAVLSVTSKCCCDVRQLHRVMLVHWQRQPRVSPWQPSVLQHHRSCVTHYMATVTYS